MEKEKVINAISAFYWLIDLDGLNSLFGLQVFVQWQRAKGEGVSFKEFCNSNLNQVQLRTVSNVLSRGVVPVQKKVEPRKNLLARFFKPTYLFPFLKSHAS